MTALRLSLVMAVSAAAGVAQLGGIYTINPMQPAGGNNFTTIGAALTALHSQTVIAPVNFQVYDDAGPWTEANPVATFINGGTAVISVRAPLTMGISAANPVVFEAAPGEFPVLDATGQPFGVVLHGTQFVTIKGFEILNATSDGVNIYTDALSQAQANLFSNAVIGCRIHDIGGCGISIYQNGGSPSIAFEGTIIRNNFLWRCQVTHAGGNATWRNGYLNERRSIRAIIENNTFFADTGVGPTFGVYCTYYAAPIGGPAASFFNNIIVKTVANGNVIRHIDAASFPLTQDNNVYEDLSGGQFLGGASGVAATFAAAQAAYPTLDANGRSGPVLLANGPTGDLHLTAGSLAIDAGAPIAAITDDIDGETRPVGSAYDAGADEFSVAGASVTAIGSGCPGSGSLVPILAGNSLPTLGNLTFALEIGNAAPQSAAFLFPSLAAATPAIPVGGSCLVHIDLVTMQLLTSSGFGPFGPNQTDNTGYTSFPLPIPALPSLIGASIYWQAGISDVGSPTGFTLTNAVATLLF